MDEIIGANSWLNFVTCERFLNILKYNYLANNNAFKWDAYRPLVDRIP